MCWFSSLVVVLSLSVFAPTAPAEGAKPAPASGGDVPLLQMGGKASGAIWSVNEEWGGTIWRYFETWQTEAVRMDDGKLIRVDPYNPRKDYDAKKIGDNSKAANDQTASTFQLQETAKITGSAFPSADWMKPDFDDSGWMRTAVPKQMAYRSLAMACLRGKFTVNDPAQVSDLNLEASIQGGAVIYLNGQEVSRAYLPGGKITNETLAEDYPKDTLWLSNGGGAPLSEAEFCNGRKKTTPEEQAGYKKRFRHISVKIPAATLRKGVNVLAIEIHRAPAAEAMFSKVYPKWMGNSLSDHYLSFWNRASVEELTLTAKAPAGAVAGNISRPAGIQVWNCPITVDVKPALYGNPSEPVVPIRLVGAKNGVFSGQVVVTATNAIKSLTVVVTDLKGQGGQIIPKSSLRIRYPRFYRSRAFDPLEESILPEIPCFLSGNSKSTGVTVQPVWVTAEVSKDAKAGDYAGEMTIRAEGLNPVSAPIQLHVSDWSIPDPKDFATYLALVESPDTLAVRYKTRMWSESHWKLIDQCFKILGTVATKELNLTLVRRTHFGNEHAMVWFVKKADGTYEPYLDIAEKYIDVGVKNLGKIPTVVFYVIEADGDGCPWITEFDPVTGELKNERAPAWGTPEAVAFWKPVFAGLRKILAKHGIEKSLCLGYQTTGNGPNAPKGCIKDFTQIAPEGRWVSVGHYWSDELRLEKGPHDGNAPWRRVSMVVGEYGVRWDPDADKPFYGWLNPYPITAYTRGSFSEDSILRDYRLASEMILFGGTEYRTFFIAASNGNDANRGTRGYGPWGADYWPVLNGGKQKLIARYNDPSAGAWDPRTCWSTTELSGGLSYLVGDGINGPVPGVRTEVMREGLQEAEAHIFCQNALLNAALKAKLGSDLAGRCKELCDNRIRALRYQAEFRASGTSKDPSRMYFPFNPDAWQKDSLKLYEMAAEVGRALGK